jgi:hypothetical protein
MAPPNQKSFRERFAAQGPGWKLNVVGSAVGLGLIAVYLLLRFIWPGLLPEWATRNTLPTTPSPLSNLLLAGLFTACFLALWLLPVIEERSPRLAARLVIKTAFAGLYIATMVDLADHWDTVDTLSERFLITFFVPFNFLLLYTFSEMLTGLITYEISQPTGPVKSGRWLAIVRWGFVAALVWLGSYALNTLASSPSPGARMALLMGAFFAAWLLLMLEGLVLEGLFGISFEARLELFDPFEPTDQKPQEENKQAAPDQRLTKISITGPEQIPAQPQPGHSRHQG